MLADEGSGTHIGRELLKAFLRKQLPMSVSKALDHQFNLDKKSVLDELNKRENAARFLSGFAPFVHEHRQDPFVQQMVMECFRDFFRSNILPYGQTAGTSIHFSGSIAYHFNALLRKVGREFKFSVGRIIQSPIAGLTLYHQNPNR
jgi:N-acetylglucosamine kinase-like BadF-type ATPase